MRAIGLFLLLVSYQCCFGQTDTNVLAIGDWSRAVSDSGGYTLRGRLVVYDAEGQNRSGIWGHARVYLKLQHVFNGEAWYHPIEIHINDMHGLHFEMRDGLDRPIIPKENVWSSRSIPPPFTVTLPCDSTLRLRGSPVVGSTTKPDGLRILQWLISPSATNDFFLSATFTPPTDNQSSPNCHVWQGTLNLPKVKIPVPVKKP